MRKKGTVPFFHERDELQPAQVVLAEEVVEPLRLGDALLSDHAEDVELDAVLAEDLDGLHHPVPRRRAAEREPMPVVQLLRPIEADTEQELVLAEEPRPLVVDEGAIGLEAVPHHLAR